MSLMIGIAGLQGTGKTTSLRNLPSEETFIVKPNNKPLPWRGWMSKYSLLSKDNPKGNMIECSLLKDEGSKKGLGSIIKYVNDKRPEIKYLVVEDMTHFFNARTLGTSFVQNTSWSKWNHFGVDTFNAMFGHELREDLVLVFIFHVEPSTSRDMNLKIKTPGNMLDREVDIPSRFTYFLHTKVLETDEGDPEDRYRFVTNNDGYHPSKTPMGLYNELYIPNDIFEVVKKIEEYNKG